MTCSSFWNVYWIRISASRKLRALHLRHSRKKHVPSWFHILASFFRLLSMLSINTRYISIKEWLLEFCLVADVSVPISVDVIIIVCVCIHFALIGIVNRNCCLCHLLNCFLMSLNSHSLLVHFCFSTATSLCVFICNCQLVYSLVSRLWLQFWCWNLCSTRTCWYYTMPLEHWLTV